MTRIKRLCAVALTAGGLAFGGAATHAAIVNAPLPASAYITQGGLDWAWAFPLPAGSAGFDLSFQSAFGWRIPTADELLSAPDATAFLFAGANVPFGGADPVSGANFQAVNAAYFAAASAGACATPYFSTIYLYCDWAFGNGQPFEPWAGSPGASVVSEQLLVRDMQVLGLPVPATISLFGSVLALAGLVALRRTRPKQRR